MADPGGIDHLYWYLIESSMEVVRTNGLRRELDSIYFEESLLKLELVRRGRLGLV